MNNINSKYNKFFFLHIDKTFGKTFSIHTMYPIYKIMEQNGISSLAYNNDHGKHNKWQDLDGETFIFSGVRDPVKRLVSHFCYSSVYNDDGFPKWNGWRDWLNPELNLENFKKWVQENNANNYQYNILTDNGRYDINERLSRINMLIKTSEIKNNELALQNLILSKVGISHEFINFNQEFEQEFNEPASIEFFNRHVYGTDFLNELIQSNYLDYEIYNSSFITHL